MTVNRSYPGLKFTRQCDVWVHIALNGEGRWVRMINKRTHSVRKLSIVRHCQLLPAFPEMGGRPPRSSLTQHAPSKQNTRIIG